MWRAEQKWTELIRAKVDFFNEVPIALASLHRLFPARPTAGTDRALLESNPSGPEGAIGSQKGIRAPGKDAFPGAIRLHSINSGVWGRAPSALVGAWRAWPHFADANKQLFHRLPLPFVEATLAAFNDGHLSSIDACARLGIGRSRLYTLRTQWLAAGRHLPLTPSGGDHSTPWPDEAEAFLRLTLATDAAPNFSFLADELHRRFAFKRSASNVRSHVLKHMAELLRKPLKRGPNPRRRWQRKGYGDLLQHDSSPHQWWPGEKLQILALTIDDATRFIVGAGFIEAETTFAHLAHVRKIFLTHGLPNQFYTDGLSLFGHESRKAGDTDTLSQFQRALGCLGVTHLVAKDPPVKGQGRAPVRLLAETASSALRHGIGQHQAASQRVARFPNPVASPKPRLTHRHAHAAEKSLSEKSACWRPAPPPELLDLHLATHHTRIVQKAGEISFLGRRWEITPGESKQVIIVQQPRSFRVISRPPTPQAPQWPDILAEYRL